MHAIRKLAPAVAAVLAMTGAVTIADTGTASAAGWGCSGSEVSDSPYPVGDPSGEVFSYVHLYWNAGTRLPSMAPIGFGRSGPAARSSPRCPSARLWAA
jgi:hypothetical protein